MAVPVMCDSKEIDCTGKAQRIQILDLKAENSISPPGLITELFILSPPTHFLVYFKSEPSGAGFGVCSPSLHACVGLPTKGS